MASDERKTGDKGTAGEGVCIVWWSPTRDVPDWLRSAALCSTLQRASTPAEARAAVRSKTARVAALVVDHSGDDCVGVCRDTHLDVSATVFTVVLDAEAASRPHARLHLFEKGLVNMVSQSEADVLACLRTVVAHMAGRQSSGGRHACPTCGLGRLTEDELVTHHPLYHIYAPNTGARCPVCRATVGNIAVHLHDDHGPIGRGESHEQGGRPTVYMDAFALVVVRRKSGEYLLVQEFAGQGYWLPGGGVDAMEHLEAGAVRETKEEGGVDVRLTGVISVDYNPYVDRGGNARVQFRVIFAGEPIDEAQLPKSIPDFESAGAVWATYAEVRMLHARNKLRGSEPAVYLRHLEEGRHVAPLSLIVTNGVPGGEPDPEA